MNYRTLGRTELEVSEVVFGGGWVGGLLILADDETKRLALHRAHEAGVNWIDTAPMYANGRSEEALGWLLSESRLDFHLSTKVWVERGRADGIAAQIERGLTSSLSRLRRDSVDLVQLHNPIGEGDGALDPADVLMKDGVVDTLERLRDQGLFTHIGMAALGQRTGIIELLDTGRFDTAQVYYNLLNPTAALAHPPANWPGHDFSGVIDACKRHGTGVMNIRVFAAGVIPTDVPHERQGPPLTRGSDLDVERVRMRAIVDALGERHGSRAQTGLRYVLSNPDIACAIVGLAELSQLDEVIAGQAMGKLPESALSELEDIQKSSFGRR